MLVIFVDYHALSRDSFPVDPSGNLTYPVAMENGPWE